MPFHFIIRKEARTIDAELETSTERRQPVGSLQSTEELNSGPPKTNPARNQRGNGIWHKRGNPPNLFAHSYSYYPYLSWPIVRAFSLNLRGWMRATSFLHSKTCGTITRSLNNKQFTCSCSMEQENWTSFPCDFPDSWIKHTEKRKSIYNTNTLHDTVKNTGKGFGT